ncbi:insulinase family protein [Nocardiopsis sp. N85]|uniref:M16 family metallopeptidase n=1 Tax=Nocardiopsis sp. N85 TaxID=3029400 RepID=UPI00237F174E|nr:M16 family metallopeptidase [Nocardiopsis sp. N85]MDE3723108.1 insulinase family protein [Nocardiopsis sp. N85]
MNTRMRRGGFLRTRLDNGLRILLAPDRRWSRVAVAVHYGVGFRAEPPGREGFAHLFEHLMFEGSESVPRGTFRTHVHEVGGIVNGTTHQDYTDYYQVVPEPLLERVLFHEADRMRAPAFTPEGLSAQLEEVAEEIERATRGRAYGGLPWPLLPGVMYSRHANAHDGYGDADALRSVTVDDCAAFFHDHYTPGNAVLTVTGAFDPGRALAAIHRHFGDIPPRERVPVPDTAEPPPVADRWARHTEPRIPATAVAFGLPLPDPSADLPGYVAHMVLARLVEDAHRAPDGTSELGAACGFFAPLDALAPDAMVLSGVLPADTSPEARLDRLRALLDTWGTGAVPGVPDTVRALVDEYREHHGSLVEHGRALGRTEILFGRAETVGEIPDLLDRTDRSAVARAARDAARAPVAALVIAPGPERTRPAPAPASRTAPTGPGARVLARTPRGPRTPPPPGPADEVAVPEHAQVRTATGTRVVTVHDDRTGTAQVRARIPLGAVGWSRPGAVDALVAAVSDRIREEAARRSLRGGLTVSTDGQWLMVSGAVDPARITAWVDVLALAVLPDGLRFRGPVPPVPRTSERTLDDLQRLLWLGGADDTATAPGPEDIARGMLSQPGAVLTLVGDLDPGPVAERARTALERWPGGGAVPVPVDPGTRLERLPVPGARDVWVGLSAPEPVAGPTEAERYLATAVFGGYHASRLARRTEGLYAAVVGRDVLLDRPRVYVRARVRTELADRVAEDLREQARLAVTEPPGGTEVEAARVYCVSQMLSALDSPTTLAHVLVSVLSAGRDADWLWRIPAELRAVTVPGVARATRALFREDAFGGVLLGAVSPQVIAGGIGKG